MVPRPKQPVSSPLNSTDASPTSSCTSTASRDEAELLQQAEASFLKKNYRQALKLCNQCLADKNKNGKKDELSVQYFQTIFELETKVCFSEFQEETPHPRQWSVRLGENLTLSDQMAAIALQSWHEISLIIKKLKSKKNSGGWEHLKPVVDFYSCSYCPMPLDFFLLWVEFWERHGYPAQTLLWTLEVLKKRSSSTTTNAAMEELLLHCLTRQLPRLCDSKLARVLAESLVVRYDSSSPSQEAVLDVAAGAVEISLYIGTFKVQKASIEAVVSVLNETSLLPLSALAESKFRLQAQLDEIAASHQQMEPSPPSDLIQIPRNPSRLPPSSSSGRLSSLLYYTRMTIQNHVQKILTSLKDSDAPNKRAKLAFSIAMALLAWRQKGIITRLSKLIVAALVSPITELVEALARPSTNRILPEQRA